MSYGQITLIRVAVFLALSWFFSKWFLLALPILLVMRVPFLVRRARVVAVLAKEYQYQFTPKPPQVQILRHLEHEMRRKKFNNTELATTFMAALCNTLEVGTEETRTFCQRVRSNARRLFFQDKAIPREMLTYLELVLDSKVDPKAVP